MIGVGLNICRSSKGNPTPLSQLDPPTNVATEDDGGGGLEITWTDPASAPVGIRVTILDSDNHEVVNEVVDGGEETYLAALGAGDFTGTLTNLGQPFVTRDSNSVPFEGTVAPTFFF